MTPSPASDLLIDTDRNGGHLPSQVLAVMAHPDDVDFGCAGTIARFSRAGVPVSYAIVTSGEAGLIDGVEPDAVADLRVAEQTVAAKILGVDDLHWLGLPDGHLEAGLETRRAISRVIRRVRPELVICQSPELRLDRVFGSHPDHLAAATSTIAAVYPDSRNPLSFPELLNEEGLEPWEVRRLWVVNHTDADHTVDVSSTIDLKIDALRAHASQTTRIPNLEEMIRGWASELATRSGLPANALVEAYLDVPTAF